MEKNSTETVDIEPTQDDKECFFNLGVFIALEAAFKSPDSLFSRESLEYKQMVRAYWRLAPFAEIYWRPRTHSSSEG